MADLWWGPVVPGLLHLLRIRVAHLGTAVHANQTEKQNTEDSKYLVQKQQNTKYRRYKTPHAENTNYHAQKIQNTKSKNTESQWFRGKFGLI